MSQPKRFSDFCKEAKPLDGARIKVDAILNKEIVVTGYKIRNSKFKDNGCGKCATVQIELDGHRNVLFTGSSVLIDQLEKYGDQIPFLTTVMKIDRFLTFS